MFRVAFRNQSRLVVSSPASVRAGTKAVSLRQRSCLPVSSTVSKSFSTSFTRSDDYDREPRRSFEPREPSPPTPTLYVGNVPWNTQEEDIRELAGQYGEINRISIGRNRDGQPRGFVHIEFASVDNSIAMFESHQKDPIFIGDRAVRLDFAQGQKRTFERRDGGPMNRQERGPRREQRNADRDDEYN